MSSENKGVTGENLTRGLESRHIQLIAIGGESREGVKAPPEVIALPAVDSAPLLVAPAP